MTVRLTDASRDLLHRVRHLEIAGRRNVASLLRGNYRTTFRGSGLDFHEARRYVPGEPIRSIDWRMTARRRAPYVRVHLEERQREVFLAVDTSPSMFTGWQARTKIETALEIAATLAASAQEAGDRIAALTFSDRVHAFTPPLAGRRGLLATLRLLLRAEREGAAPAVHSDPRAAIHHVQSLPGRRFLVFLISDLFDVDVPDDLRFLAARHDATLIRVRDPLEIATFPALVQRAVHPAEDRPEAESDHDSLHRTWRDPSAELETEARRRRVQLIDLLTTDPIGPSLAHHFHRRQLELRR